jgi:hypothetical protein
MSDDMMPEDTADAIDCLQHEAQWFQWGVGTPAEFIGSVINICKAHKNDEVFAERLMFQLMQFFWDDSALPERCQASWLRDGKGWLGEGPPPTQWLVGRVTPEALERAERQERKALERAAQQERELEQAIQEEREAERELEWQIDQWLDERERRGRCCSRCAAVGLSWRPRSGGTSSGFAMSVRPAPSRR